MVIDRIRQGKFADKSIAEGDVIFNFLIYECKIITL